MRVGAAQRGALGPAMRVKRDTPRDLGCQWTM